jgi:tetratricopeptide (TPR) repeat protein
MEKSSKWIVYGVLSLLTSIFIYSIFVSDQISSTFYLTIVGVSIWIIMIGLFMTRKYHNFSIYLILTAVILVIVITLIYNQILSLGYHYNNIYSYIISGILILTTIYGTYEIIQTMKLYQNTAKTYEKDLEINPKNTTALNNKGVALAERKFNQEALECFDKILQIDPKDGAAWHNKGVILNNLRKHQEALKYYDQALTLDPKLKNAKQAGKIILEN